ncbi:MAG: PDZ domain-containing protein [Candidatus Latescibacteria bacterium]|nr:PDZ domain-containing protein [Candidatus Latescibacterota bacterium]NIM66458.1 PDZ domain-containing protein [Candidatus Latescibacterota bacterium]NIO02938.1 PDZ domain-containing protein [Candidatus Latescibacterota bacterium]NIO30073.1 PDZ domain-containing protein [Candidatus Latescibacterota bacterium]NIO57688.1 PDZ domain-containing protein [Candidatus Latescibacterota bacterium]
MKLLPARKTIFSAILLTAICVALIAWGGSRYQGDKHILHDLEIFAKVVEKIRSYYVDEVDTHELVNEAIENMLRDLDPHSQFLQGLEYEDLMVSTRGEFGGVGMLISFRDNYPTVITPIEGTPAYRAGLRGGDQIVEIEGQATHGWSTQKAVKLLRGDPGTDVTFMVSRPGLKEPVEYQLTREIIVVKSVPFHGMFGDYGYIKISNFSKQTRDELKETLEELEGRQMKGLVIDVRSNPGGLLQAATEVSELFLDRDKLIVYTKGRLSNSNQKYFSTNSRTHKGYPIVVMLNMASASASEIFAGALQDWDLGFVVGQTSFGKGTVQTVFSLSDTEAIKLTTAKYYTPSGRNIHRDHGKFDSSRRTLTQAGSDTLSDDIASLRPSRTGEESDASAPEEKPIFYTASGRIVYGGGGITPDLEFEPEMYTELQRNLEKDALFFSFAVKYATENKVTEDFEATEKILEDFKTFLTEREFELDEEEFSKAENREYITMAIEREIFSSNFGRDAMYRVVLEKDPEFQRVLELLNKYPTLEKLFAYAEEQKSLKAARIEAE